MKKNFTLPLFFLLVTLTSQGQDAASVRSKCQSSLQTISDKISDLNREYEHIKEDLKAGLFCSKCGESKTELDKKEGFYQHLQNVKGQPVPADQQRMNAAHQKYLAAYNSLKSQYDSKQKACDDQYNDAVKQQQEKAEQDRLDAQQKQNELMQEAQANAEKQRLEQQQKLQELNDQLARQREENRQKILQDVEKNKQDAEEMFRSDADRMTQSIRSIALPQNNIGFESNNVFGGIEPSGLSGNNNIEDFDFDNSGLGNMYLDQYGSQVKDVTTDYIISESHLPEFLQNGYDKISSLFTTWGVGQEVTSGTIGSETVEATFSHTPNAVVREIQKYSGNIAVRQSEKINHLTDQLLNDDFNEQAVVQTMREMQPFYVDMQPARPTRPFGMKDAVVVVGGGLFLATVGAPVWIGIGAAAWYGFTR
jgi:hypothetical protein